MNLSVVNLPENRLALTNCVYASPGVVARLVASLRSPETESEGTVLVSVGGDKIYACRGHPSVAPDGVAMNSLQRRFSRLAMNTSVEVRPFSPPPSAVLGTLEFGVDLLAKRSGGGGRPREIDTDALAKHVSATYDGHFFATGQSAAVDLEGVKLLLTVRRTATVALDGGKADDSEDERGGRLLSPTQISFSKESGAAAVALVGEALADGGGGGGGNNIFLKDFDFVKLGIGGLTEEFNQIFRRAFASRVWPQRIVRQLGINHVRGMLLHGPPGCGKTLIARQIGRVLNAREPKIVNGPEILNKYVGGSEEKIRELFADAEKEQAEAGDASMLHIVILDEMDAICKTRGTARDGTGVSDSVVNQLLSKIDGVDSLNNILLIGMTNRKDMIDDALLRPGRLEVHVEIGLPDEKGRVQVLTIHTDSMRKHKRVAPDVLQRIPELAKLTKNFSGAEIEGLVKAATSFALTRCVDVKDLSKPPDEKNLVVQFHDFKRALDDVEPKFGARSDALRAAFRNGIVPHGDAFRELAATADRLVEQVRASDRTPLMTVLLKGEHGAGKSAFAAKVAVDSGFPFVRAVDANDMIGMSDAGRCAHIQRVFLDSYKSPLSVVVVDDLERVVDYVPIGPRFSNAVLQTLLVLLRRPPPDEGRRLLVVGTTSVPGFLEDLGLARAFDASLTVPLLDAPDQIETVLRRSADVHADDARAVAAAVHEPVGVKRLLTVAEMAKQRSKDGDDDDGDGKGRLDVNVFMECLHIVGY